MSDRGIRSFLTPTSLKPGGYLSATSSPWVVGSVGRSKRRTARPVVMKKLALSRDGDQSVHAWYYPVIPFAGKRPYPHGEGIPPA